MSRKQNLQKAIALSLLLTNVWCGTALAERAADGADGNSIIVTGAVEGSDYGQTKEYIATNGSSGASADIDPDSISGGNGGNGGSVTVDQTITGNHSGNNFVITATGGKGGYGGRPDTGFHNDPANGGHAGHGGTVSVGLTLEGTEFLIDNLTITATAGNSNYAGDAGGNFGIGGNGGHGGNATVKGIIVSDVQEGADLSITAADINITATGGNAGSAGSGYMGAGLVGNGGAAEAYGISNANQSLLTVNAASISVTAIGGNGGNAAYSERIDANIDGGIALSSKAYGVHSTAGTLALAVTGDITAAVTGGQGGQGGSGFYTYADGNSFDPTKGGSVGEVTAAGLSLTNTVLQGAVDGVVKAEATGGKGGKGGKGASGGYQKENGDLGELGAEGGNAYAAGIELNQSVIENLTVDEINAEVTGGVGGDGGNGGRSYFSSSGNGGDGNVGARGGNAYAAGLAMQAGEVKELTVTSISAKATGGSGGSGGNGGELDSGGTGTSGNGGNGGNGGNAYAAGLYAFQSAHINLAADSITAEAAGGAAGSGGAAGAGDSGGSTGTAGTAGDMGEEAKAYAVYGEQGAVIELQAKTPDKTIQVGAKASGANENEAYAVYADNAVVLFHDNAELNSDGSGEDNTVITRLNNAVLGFGGEKAGRTITGGTLQLDGSNTFVVNTDLASGTADKFTFDSLAAGSSTATQYITVGYDKDIDPYQEGYTEATGTPIEVFAITNMNGQTLGNFVGGTNTLDSVLYQFNATTDIEKNGNTLEITGVTTTKTLNPSESIKTAVDAQMAGSSLWRAEGSSLMKRMGDLRNDKEAAEGGVWARYYRGELSADSAYDRSFDQDYTAFQGGIDKVQDYKGGKLYTGIAVNRIDSNAGYNSGSGELSSTGLGIYASWLGSKGHYIDVIARGSKLANDFKLVDLSGNKVSGDYDTWAYGLSAEYGYRQDMKAGWFVEPQAELSFGHIKGADYELSNGARVENSSINSAVARLGILSGKEFTIGGRPSNAYVKASLLHDFGGNGNVTASYLTERADLETGDIAGTWYEIGVGANLGLGKNSNLYFDALKTFSSNLRTEWQFNAGLRFTF